MSAHELSWPPRFGEWPRDAQVAYLKWRLTRPEMVAAIGDLADIESIQRREIDPDNARLTKPELAIVLLELGIYHRDLDQREEPWF